MAKKQQIKNYARFYTLLKEMPGATKENLVRQYTNDRSESLKEMKSKEYKDMCADMEKIVHGKASYIESITAMKAARSAVLKRLQKIGIDTTNWSAVDNFCMNPKIRGKPFRQLTYEDLENLIPKLESILKKDSIKENLSSSKSRKRVMIISPIKNIEA